jgi:HEAT repeat protein
VALLPRIEHILIQALDLDSRPFNRGRGGSVGKSDAVRGAICSALGQIGGANAARTLGRLTEERNLLVQDRALRALRQLEERVGLQAA